jgi:O-acetyl-ADP-ribose deacetylase (regulator of RNase III)
VYARTVDVVLISAAVFELPPSQRAGAIVYDGTTDLGLWRPRGPDRDLLDAYGESLPAALAKERAQLTGGRLAVGQALRLHPGKLRCDYLIWVGSRPPHSETETAAAPSLESIEGLVRSALVLAAKHGTLRVAFGALGAGPGAADAAERMAAVVRGADAFRASCLQQGSALPIEEVLVCSTHVADVAKARRATARMAKEPAPSRPLPSATRSDRPSAPRAPRGPTPSASRRGRARRLDPAEVASARVRAAPYDRGRAYATGDWFIHPAFGAGQVQAVFGPERMISALFEDGEERRMIHART